jgi:nicotinic acid mononucleotide adenylyltransferase
MCPAADGVPDEPSILLIDAKTTAVSASDVRARATRGESLTGLVPANVSAYLQKHALYAPKGHA